MRRRGAVPGRRAPLGLVTRLHGPRCADQLGRANRAEPEGGPARSWWKPAGQQRAAYARRDLAPHRPPPGRALLPLDAWLSAPAWLEDAQADPPPGWVGDAVMMGEPARCGDDVRRADLDGIFGLWLQRTLHSLFAAVAEEPVPAELLRILEEAPETDRTEDSDKP
jgi:hypothetical protein